MSRSVFISWSGDRSKHLAEFLHGWLPNVIQTVVPFVSSQDIENGDPWFATISESMAASAVGIVVITPENEESRWLNFEAGGLSRVLESKRACPLVVGMSKTALRPPLGELQAADASIKDDVHKLIRAINTPNEVPFASVDHAFNREWPDLEALVARLAANPPPDAPEGRQPDEMIPEILALLREQNRARPPFTPSGRAPRLPFDPIAEMTAALTAVGLIASEWTLAPTGTLLVCRMDTAIQPLRSLLEDAAYGRVRSGWLDRYAVSRVVFEGEDTMLEMNLATGVTEAL